MTAQGDDLVAVRLAGRLPQYSDRIVRMVHRQSQWVGVQGTGTAVLAEAILALVGC